LLKIFQVIVSNKSSKLISLIFIALPTTSTIPKENPSESKPIVHEEPENPSEEKGPREIKLYSAAQFRSHINRLYPFHLDYFSEKLSSLDFEQHRMGLYIFYDINNGYLINDLEKESNKKSSRGKNMKVKTDDYFVRNTDEYFV
jgi:hypothetical protein